MDATVERHDKPLATPYILHLLPTELWLTIFEHVVTYDTHIFNQSLQYRRKRTREIQKLQFVCRLWRDIIKPLLYHHIVLNGNGSNGSQYSCHLVEEQVAALAGALSQTNDSDTPRASLVRSFWIQRHDQVEDTEQSRTVLQEKLSHLICRMTRLSELCCLIDLCGPQVASIARTHGSRLTKLAVQSGGTVSNPINSSEMFQSLKTFTVLTDLCLRIQCPMGDLNSINTPNLPNLRVFELVSNWTADDLMTWLTRWTMPVLSSFAWRGLFGSSWHMCNETSGLSTFMAKFGAGLKTLKIDDSCQNIQRAIFPHTPRMEVFEVFEVKDVLENLPTSVTVIVLRRFGEHVGYQVRALGQLFQTAQLLPPEKRLHIIRVVEKTQQDDENFPNGAPYIWREKMQHADMRRVNTWKQFKSYANGLLELGVVVLDEQDVALTDIVEEMEASQELICTELVESAADTRWG